MDSHSRLVFILYWDNLKSISITSFWGSHFGKSTWRPPGFFGQFLRYPLIILAKVSEPIRLCTSLDGKSDHLNLAGITDFFLRKPILFINWGHSIPGKETRCEEQTNLSMSLFSWMATSIHSSKCLMTIPRLSLVFFTNNSSTEKERWRVYIASKES